MMNATRKAGTDEMLEIDQAIRWTSEEIVRLSEEGSAWIRVVVEGKYPDWLKASNRYDAIQEESAQLREQMADLMQRRDSLFFRPKGRLVSLLNRWLGPLPRGMEVIDPTTEALQEVKSYRIPALLTMLFAAVMLVALSLSVPWLAFSPFRAVYSLVFMVTGQAAISTSAAVFAMVVFMIVFPATLGRMSFKGKWLDRMAMLEEQWFRSGTESWTWRQRVYSCVVFGAVHIGNFIYPLASVIVLGLVGGVFMAVYLRAYRQTGSTRVATLASAKFHATYNRFAFVYMGAALIVLLVFLPLSM